MCVCSGNLYLFRTAEKLRKVCMPSAEPIHEVLHLTMVGTHMWTHTSCIHKNENSLQHSFAPVCDLLIQLLLMC